MKGRNTVTGLIYYLNGLMVKLDVLKQEKKKDEGDSGTKEQNELGLKIPKMLEDQMWKLIHLYAEDRSNLVTVGFVMMGTSTVTC